MATESPLPPVVTESRPPIIIVGRPGLPFNISGSGFGSSGSLTVGGVSLPTTSWRDDRIKGQLPLDLKSGTIEVITASGKQVGVWPTTLKDKLGV